MMADSMEMESAPQEEPGMSFYETLKPDSPKEEMTEPQQAVPTYRVVDAAAETEDDWPGPRCAHTLTALTGIGKEGTPGYVPPRLVLFGGAMALERTSGTGLPPSPSGDPGIRLAEVTADVHCFDTSSNKWRRFQPSGIPPSPRAAHAATAVGPMVVIQGGIGPAGFSSEDLHVLDFSQSEAKWHRVVVKGPGPGSRYGHIMALVAQRFLLLVSGNDGVRLLADVWVLDTATKPYQWKKVEAEGDGPPPCMYAASSTRKDGLLLFSGGRDSSGVPLPGAYRLRNNQGGHWHWDRVPGPSPSPRYQHAAAFANGRYHISGGACGRGQIVDDHSTIAALDTKTGVWYDIKSISGHSEPDSPTKRCRHAAAGIGSSIYIYGGLKAGVLFSDLLVAIDGTMELEHALNEKKSVSPRVPPENLKSLVDAATAEAEAISAVMARAQYQGNGDANTVMSRPDVPMHTASGPGSDVRLHHKAVVATETGGGILGSLVRQLSLDRFENEGRRVSTDDSRKVLDRQMSMYSVHKKILSLLLKPRGWRPSMRRSFFMEFNEVLELCEAAENIFKAEPNVLKLKAPVKIFGDLHGQFGDLMRLFDEYGSPSTAGDISYIDYLFLGDYVDRGQHSLETIFLLLALKIEHPGHVHMIRGNHEAADINALFGFRTECVERMGEWEGVWAWHRINQLFNWLPLAAVIENKIICMHGGIGRSINYIDQIEGLNRPITMDTGSVVLMDLLWSDPTENDSVQGIQPNARGPGLVTFGPDRVMEFCKKNDLQLIIRAHECVMDGFERFAQGHLITLFSATNYCGTANNAGAILVLGRDLVVVPKLIHPIPPFPEEHMDPTWMQELNVQRPPTPTRGRPQSVADRSSLAYI